MLHRPHGASTPPKPQHNNFPENQITTEVLKIFSFGGTAVLCCEFWGKLHVVLWVSGFWGVMAF